MPFSPQFRFGYGLSYTQFKYSSLQIHPRTDDPGFVEISVDIENTGNYGGDEVVQLYLTDVVASVSTPVIELQGFKRVPLRAGEKKTILRTHPLSTVPPRCQHGFGEWSRELSAFTWGVCLRIFQVM